MPLIENDLFYPYIRKGAKHSKIAERILYQVANAEIKNVYSPTLCLIELALVYRSLGEEEKLTLDLAKLISVGGIEWIDLKKDEVVVAADLRRDLGIDFWNSHHAAVALDNDKTVISTDDAYGLVPGLKRIDPRKL